jgi:neutral trehalase
LKELETLFSRFEIHITQQMATAVFKVVGEITLNENVDVAEAAIDILMNPSLAFTIKNHANWIYPLLIGPTYRAARKHWDEVIRANAFVALQTLAELDQSTFNRVKDGLKPAKSKAAAQGGTRNSNWLKVFDAAKAIDRTVKPIISDGTRNFRTPVDIPPCFCVSSVV